VEGGRGWKEDEQAGCEGRPADSATTGNGAFVLTKAYVEFNVKRSIVLIFVCGQESPGCCLSVLPHSPRVDNQAFTPFQHQSETSVQKSITRWRRQGIQAVNNHLSKDRGKKRESCSFPRHCVNIYRQVSSVLSLGPRSYGPHSGFTCDVGLVAAVVVDKQKVAAASYLT
jgi:hypothetical protein